MKLYIFLTFDIQDIGGGQCYVANKAEYLEKTGWKVLVFSNSYRRKGGCPIDYLNQYLNLKLLELSYPAHLLPNVIVCYAITKLIKRIGEAKYDEIIIESHDDKLAIWGELLAIKLSSRHFVVPLNEHYRGIGKYYEDKLDFYSFKFDRGELSSDLNIATRLFNGYREVNHEKIRHWIIDEDPVRDYNNELVNSIIKKDWNICYIGRGAKSYVPNILSGIGEFASMYQMRTIQFIVVGDAVSVHKKLIDHIIGTNPNLTCLNLGNQTPLPRSLYKKVDVVIAGSGSARCSAEEGALTLVVDAESGLCNGLLGYETMGSIYSSSSMQQTSIASALERVLVQKIHERLSNYYPSKLGVELCTQQNFDMINMADNNLEYYPQQKLLAGHTSFRLFADYMYTSITQNNIIKPLIKILRKCYK